MRARGAWSCGMLVAMCCACSVAKERGEEPGRADGAVAAPAIYAYTTPAGTEGFADSLGQIPRPYRGGARIKLVDGVSLNHELAREFTAQVEAEHAALAASDGCAHARATSAETRGPLAAATLIWQRHSLWVVVAGAVLLLLVTAPFVARRVGATRWARAVAVGIGALVFVGVLGHVGLRATDTLRGVRRIASLCDDASSDPVVRARTVAELRNRLVGLGGGIPTATGPRRAGAQGE